MKISRSSIEKHIRVLLKANIIKKEPGLSSKGNLRIYYKIKKPMKDFLHNVLDMLKEF